MSVRPSAYTSEWGRMQQILDGLAAGSRAPATRRAASTTPACSQSNFALDSRVQYAYSRLYLAFPLRPACVRGCDCMGAPNGALNMRFPDSRVSSKEGYYK
jgi:hypothetical protein